MTKKKTRTKEEWINLIMAITPMDYRKFSKFLLEEMTKSEVKEVYKLLHGIESKPKNWIEEKD